MHLFHGIMLYQQCFVLFISKSHPHISVYLAEFRKYANCHKNPLQTHGIPRGSYFCILHFIAFRNFGTKTYCKLITTPNRKKLHFFPRECLFLLKPFFLSCSEFRMAVFMWLAIMVRYNQFHSHLNQQVRTECNNQRIVNSVWEILSNSPISEF